jgi:hypothetical protein
MVRIAASQTLNIVAEFCSISRTASPAHVYHKCDRNDTGANKRISDDRATQLLSVVNDRTEAKRDCDDNEWAEKHRKNVRREFALHEWVTPSNETQDQLPLARASLAAD